MSEYVNGEAIQTASDPIMGVIMMSAAMLVLVFIVLSSRNDSKKSVLNLQVVSRGLHENAARLYPLKLDTKADADITDFFIGGLDHPIITPPDDRFYAAMKYLTINDNFPLKKTYRLMYQDHEVHILNRHGEFVIQFSGMSADRCKDVPYAECLP